MQYSDDTEMLTLTGLKWWVCVFSFLLTAKF